MVASLKPLNCLTQNCNKLISTFLIILRKQITIGHNLKAYEYAQAVVDNLTQNQWAEESMKLSSTTTSTDDWAVTTCPIIDVQNKAYTYNQTIKKRSSNVWNTLLQSQGSEL